MFDSVIKFFLENRVPENVAVPLIAIFALLAPPLVFLCVYWLNSQKSLPQPLKAFEEKLGSNKKIQSNIVSLNQLGHFKEWRVIHPPALRIWGKLPDKTRIYLSIEFTPLASLWYWLFPVNFAAELDSSFKKRFFVDSNYPQVISNILTDDIQNAINKYKSFRYMTGSLISLLPPDYFNYKDPQSKIRQYYFAFASTEFETQTEENALLQLLEAINGRIAAAEKQIEKQISIESKSESSTESFNAGRASYGSRFDKMYSWSLYAIAIAYYLFVLFFIISYLATI